MAGAYCMFCGRRCFVYREVIVGGALVWAGHLATCAKGKEFDRSKLGRDSDTAHNPTPHRLDGKPTCPDCAPIEELTGRG